MSVRIIKPLSGGLQNLRKQVQALGQNEVLVGFPENSGNAKTKSPSGALVDAGVKIATVAAVHEFGAPEANIPERSFLRAGLRSSRKQLTGLIKKLAPLVSSGKMGAPQALGLIGELGKSLVQQHIRHGEFTPLSPKTVAAKGSSKPLIDTGNMVQSVSYVVEKVGKK